MPRWTLLAFAAATVWAQQAPAPKPEYRVQGVVQDALTGQPIREARVAVVEGMLASTTAVAASNLVTRTSATGTFEIKLNTRGQASVWVEADGYIQEAGSAGWFTATSAATPATVTVKLRRKSALVGRIVDADDKKPVGGIEILPYTGKWHLGRLGPGVVLAHTSPIVTDSTGTFRIDGLAPGGYWLELVASSAKETAITGEVVRIVGPATKTLDYGRQWWPGGGDFDSAIPITLPEGLDMELGDVPVLRQELYRADFRLRADSCSTGDSYALALSTELGLASWQGLAGATVPCGAQFHFANLASGKYLLVSPIGSRTSSGPQFVREWVNITDRNWEQDISPKPDIQLTGKIDLPDSFSIKKDHLRVTATATESFLGVSEGGGQVAGDGAFGLNLTYVDSVRIQVLGIPPGFYISEMLYNGFQLRDGLLTPNESSPVQNLKITVADKASSVRGRVTNDHGDAVPNATVMAVPWPIRTVSGFPIYFSTVAGSDGAYVISGLAPDKYHVLAVAGDALDGVLQKPRRIEIVASGGAEAGLSEGNNQQIDLKLTEVFRD